MQIFDASYATETIREETYQCSREAEKLQSEKPWERWTIMDNGYAFGTHTVPMGHRTTPQHRDTAQRAREA